MICLHSLLNRIGSGLFALTVLGMLAAVQPAHGQTETVLYSFQGSPDGGYPYYATPVVDKKGNLYGTTNGGGAYGAGTVFRLTPSGPETILHSFGASGDGTYPGAGLVRDAKGNLYGTTLEGGAYGYGTVFKLTPSGTETILHSFGASGDGAYPYAGLVLDKKGNLYGTTSNGGTYGLSCGYGCGTVFELTPSGTETILHSFDKNGIDGYYPFVASLILDKAGNVYGTTNRGGTSDGGTVFKLTPLGGETILWSFGNGTDGYYPYGGLVLGKKGALYGTTQNGGTYGVGTVFKVTSSGTETILYNFDANGTDAYNPVASLVFDKLGNLYSTTAGGGAYALGTVFELTPNGTETVLHSFGASGDGYYPYGGLVLDKAGNLYGMTQGGGTYGYGTVYKLTP